VGVLGFLLGFGFVFRALRFGGGGGGA
jgi:hypothetical protein